MTGTPCPKCGFTNEGSAEDCVRCGRRLRVARANPPLPPATGQDRPEVQGRGSDASQDQGPDETRTHSQGEGQGGGADQSPAQSLNQIEDPHTTRSRVGLLVIIAMMTIGSILYRLLVWKQLEQTSLLFIGIPAMLAACVVFTPKARSPMGLIMRGMTICLLMSGILLGEGFICILMASPIFYAVGLLAAGIIQAYGRSGKVSQGRTLCVVLLVLLPLSLEGSSPRLSFNRAETVQVERIVDLSPTQVEENLARPPVFNRRLPFYLRLGFPRPVGASGSGLNPGDRRTIDFAGGEGKPGSLAMEVAEHRAGLVRFQALKDSSHVSHWLDWGEAEVSFNEIAPGRTRIVWTLSFTRRLDPAWYFAPWERYAATLAARYLIDTVAAPDFEAVILK